MPYNPTVSIIDLPGIKNHYPMNNLVKNLAGTLISDDELPNDHDLPLGKIKWQLFLTSFAILYFELICIRWLPAYVRFLGYFMNFILLAAFLGIGVGIMISRREKLRIPNFFVWLFLLVAVTRLSQFELYLPSTQVLYYVAGEKVAPPENGIVLPIIFFLVTVGFVILARPLGKLLRMLPPLQAYTLDILGSLAGIATFFFISYFSLPPYIWFILLVLLVLFALPSRNWVRVSPFFLGIVVIVYGIGLGSSWSPYYRIQVGDDGAGGHVINVNNVGHQTFTHYLNKEAFYFRVYDLFGKKPFKRVLVLGAGSGSDVAIALNSGAENVDAVEIDPIIYRLGIQLNPDHPYNDPRVKVYINDGRSFLQNSHQKYDLIIFALPDSLTLTSSYSSLRLESFLLTTDAIETASHLLSEDGLIVLYNYYRQDFLVRKLAGMVDTALGSPPYVTTYGAYGRAAVIMGGPRLAELDPALNIPYTENNVDMVSSGRGIRLPIIGHGRMNVDPSLALASDDWPFVYMPVPTIPTLYLGALGIISLLALLLIAASAPREIISRFDWHFFLLGVAFMLLETRSLVTFGLLFGNTWMVNSLVFFAILSSVLLAILFNTRFKMTRIWILYVLLFLFLLLNYFLPFKTLLGISSPAVRYGLASFLTFAPIFCANVVFSHSFRDSLAADIAFASNLLGAMLGGMFEYFALALGYKTLLIFVLVFYVLAYLTRLSRNRQLELQGNPKPDHAESTL
jgi:spermidine synthase